MNLHIRVLRLAYLLRIPETIEKFIHVRWLNLSGNTFSPEELKIIFKLYKLKTLDLSHCDIKDISAEIGNLICLTHLDLSPNEFLKELPREIGNLVLLRKLNLRKNTCLVKLPETICGLHKLRTLNIEDCPFLCTIPEGLAQLTSLFSLREFRGRSAWSKLGLLKNLTHLGKEIHLIIRLGGDADLESLVEDAREANLRNVKDIETLDIEFEDEKVEASCSSNRKRMDVIDALEPHPNLNYLIIQKYKGFKLPGWMGSPLNQLVRIDLEKCHHLTALPSLGKLPCLEDICIDGMDELEMLRREFLGFTGCSSDAPVISFPKLIKLEIEGCGKWKEWEDNTEEEASPAYSVMSCLDILRISNCVCLTALPHRLIRKAFCLRILDISSSMLLKNRYLDMDDAEIDSTG